VVIWNHLLGDFQWWKESLSWSGPPLTGPTTGEWTEIGQAIKCCLLRFYVCIQYLHVTIRRQIGLSTIHTHIKELPSKVRTDQPQIYLETWSKGLHLSCIRCKLCTYSFTICCTSLWFLIPLASVGVAYCTICHDDLTYATMECLSPSPMGSIE